MAAEILRLHAEADWSGLSGIATDGESMDALKDLAASFQAAEEALRAARRCVRTWERLTDAPTEHDADELGAEYDRAFELLRVALKSIEERE